jgi:TRAP-type C4-dicarboxylate transport system substrate-binding protein
MAFDWWGPEFTKRSEGRYKIELYPANSLISSTAALDSVKKRVAEIIVTSTSTFPKDFPLNMVTNIPTLGFPVNTYDQTFKCWDAQDEFYNTYPELQAEFKDFKLLLRFGITVSHLLTKSKEVHYPADLKGMRIGGSGDVMQMVADNGGAAVNQVPPDAYLNFDKGLVDGAFVSYMQIADHKLYSVAKHLYDQDYGQGTMLVMMNWEAWNAMTPQDHKLMEDTWAEARDKAARYLVDAQSAVLETPDFKKLNFIVPTTQEAAAWTRASEPCLRKWRDTSMALGMDIRTCDKILEGWKSIRMKYLAK